MRRSHPQHSAAADSRVPLAVLDRAALAQALGELLARGDAEARHQPWDITMPAGLHGAPLTQPFDEPLDGMAIREVVEPAVFRRFFGR
ncbi:MAG TPA: hypothetical protein VGE16_01560 [Albitalea sp.]